MKLNRRIRFVRYLRDAHLHTNGAMSHVGVGATREEAEADAMYWNNQEPWCSTVAYSRAPKYIQEAAWERLNELLAREEYRAAYWISTDGQASVRLTGREHAHLSEGFLIAEAQREAKRMDMDLSGGHIDIGLWRGQ